MGIVIESAGLHVVTVPKCACSSVKHFVHEALTGSPFVAQDVAGKKGIHQAYKSVPFAETQAAQTDGLMKVAVVRHPVDRLLSCYLNKVRGKANVLARTSEARFKKAGVSASPTPLEFVENLETYRKLSQQIRRHSEKLTFFLGTDPSWFDRIFDISEVGQLFELINARAGTTIGPKARNRTSEKSEIAQIDQVADRITADFAEDLTVFGDWIKTKKWAADSAAA